MFYVCWTIDCESSHPDIGDTALGRNAIQGFTEILESAGWRGTLFLIPEELRPMADLLQAARERGHEIGLHLHPRSSGYESDYLGAYSAQKQADIIGSAVREFETVLGFRPVSCRPGYCSANDATFSVLADLGFTHASASMPGRQMSPLASNWAGAPLFIHYANPYNRFLAGGLDLVEIPISVDWDSRIWGGLHCQDLRVEFTDAKNHSFLIDKVMRRQCQENTAVKCLVALTHNLYRFSDAGDFRRETLLGMMDRVRRSAEQLNDQAAGVTLGEVTAAFRNSGAAA